MSRAAHTGRHKPQLSKEGTRQSYSQFCDKLKRSADELNVPLEEVFLGLIHLGASIPFGKLAMDDGPSLYSIASALLASACNITSAFPMVSPERTPRMAIDFAKVAAIDAEGIQPDAYVSATTFNERRELLKLNMIFTICENAIYQGDFQYKMINQLVLTGIIGFRNLPEDSQRTEQLFQELLGLSAYDYLLALFAIWSTSLKGCVIDMSVFIPDTVSKSLRNACTALVDELSQKFSDLPVKVASSPFDRYSGKAKSLAVFSRWPLIQVGQTEYCVASHQFVRIQLTSKLLTKALAMAREKEGVPDTQYSQFLGTSRFEPFFRELCDIWDPVDGHYDEYEYAQKSSAKSADRIAFERHGSKTVVHLFQLKLKMLTEQSHYGTSMEAVLKDFRSAFAKLIANSIKFLVALRDASYKNRLNPANQDLSLKILCAHKYCFIGIVPDLPSVFIFKEVREALVSEVKSLLNSKEENCWFEKNIDNCVWHIMELPEFEVFISLPKAKRDLHKSLASYFRDSQINAGLVNAGHTMPRDFRSYLISKNSSSDKLTHIIPEMHTYFEEINNDVVRAFFGDPCTWTSK